VGSLCLDGNIHPEVSRGIPNGWAALYANSGATPSVEQLATLIGRAKDFIVGVQAMVLQETKDWVTEFQTNLAQLDKEARAQLDTLKAQVEKAAETRGATERPGWIELTVPNADKADGFAFEVLLEDNLRKVTESKITGAKQWIQLNLARKNCTWTYTV
jgi:hypothetical protein